MFLASELHFRRVYDVEELERRLTHYRKQLLSGELTPLGRQVVLSKIGDLKGAMVYRDRLSRAQLREYFRATWAEWNLEGRRYV